MMRLIKRRTPIRESILVIHPPDYLMYTVGSMYLEGIGLKNKMIDTAVTR